MPERPRSIADLPDFTQPASGLPSVAVRKAPPKPPKPAVEPVLPPYRPVRGRLRAWIVGLTLVTVVGIAVLMVQPHLQLRAAKAARAEAAARSACPGDAASAAPGCPGSTMPVMVLPAAPRPAAAARP